MFPEVQAGAPVGASDSLHLDERRFTVRVDGDSEILVDLTGWGRPLLAAGIAGLLRESIRQSGPSPLARTVRRQVQGIRRFWQFLATSSAVVDGVQDIAASVLDRYEDWLAQTVGGQRFQRHLLGLLINLMRIFADRHPEAVQHPTMVRLSYISGSSSGPVRPRDAYSSGIAAALRAAGRSQVEAAARRIVCDAASPIAPEWTAASTALHRNYEFALTEIARAGQIAPDHKLYRRFYNLAMYWKRQGPFLIGMHAHFHLTRIDLVGFVVLLSLETGMEIECLLGLRADCLKNPSKGYVEVEYHKRRARSAEWKHLRVPDRGTTTTGGLLRLALKLTARARHHLGTDALWAHWSGHLGGLTVPKEDVPLPAAAFVQAHGLADDNDQPLRLTLSRLRKTHKAAWYIRTHGQMEQFAVGHTPDVAARHYADIPALRHVHQQAVSDAFQDALDSALKLHVIPPSEEDAMRKAPHTAALPVAASAVVPLLDGEQDVWLASCAGFHNSPFGLAGEACPIPFWGCLECSNAVITARKLPVLLAFLEFVLLQRKGLSAADWSAKFGRAHRRITEQILPAFPAAVVEDARAAAASVPLPYLPPEASAG